MSIGAAVFIYATWAVAVFWAITAKTWWPTIIVSVLALPVFILLAEVIK